MRTLALVALLIVSSESPAIADIAHREQLEREVVVDALERNGWNQAAAARFLRIPRHTLIYRLEKFGISLPDKKG